VDRPTPATTEGSVESRPVGLHQKNASSRLSLERTTYTLVDSWLPSQPRAYLFAVAAISAACWLAGFLLAADKARFVASLDWQAQPVFIAAHLIMLRLFVTNYTRGFLAGCEFLTIPPDEARRRVTRALGPRGGLLALLFAAWFVFDDLRYLFGGEYVGGDEAQGAGGAIGLADWLTGAIWTAEWIINAYVWVLILAFLALTMRVLKQYTFREPVDVVLAQRHYRPFLVLSAHGATIVLLFSIVAALYVWRVQGETTDYVGLWIMAGLLIVGFVPPWMRLKNGIARLARVEADRLNREIIDGWRTLDGGEAPDSKSTEGLAARVGLLISMARAGHLERLYRDLGRSEGQAVLIRLIAPLTTAVWRVFRPG
jgi:hypothetical protein